MRKGNTNKFLLVILVILIILTVTMIILYLNNKKTDEDIHQDVEEEVEKYENEYVSYYDYFKSGLLDIDIDQYVKLPEDYLEYKIISKTQEETRLMLDIIIQNSQVEIPNTLLNGYYGDIYNNTKMSAKAKQKTLDDYIKGEYGYDSYKKYIEENTKYYKEEIKKDLVYNALAKDLSISITKDNVEDYFSERLQNGDTYESLVELYGEKLMYKYTLQDRIEKELMQKLSN